jgi:thiol:disulfide interchange protein DsbC
MTTRTKILVAAAAVAFAASSFAAPTPAPGTHNETAQLPITGMVAAVKNGKLAFVSTNGRFVFQGKMFDAWNQKEIETVADAKLANDFMDLKKLDFRVKDLRPMEIGTGEKQIVVFYDPYCPSCHHLLDDARKVDGYTFNFVAIPVMGNPSVQAVRYSFCTTDKELSEKLLLGKIRPEKIPQTKFENCDTTAIAKRVVSAQLFGIQGVPFMVRDDGLVRNGYLKGDLKNWLEAGK